MRGLIRDSLAEMLSRKILFVFGFVTLIGLVIILLSSNLEINIQGESLGAQELNESFGNPVLGALNGFAYFLIFLAVIATAWLIPDMFVRGRAEFYLSKPLSRGSLLLNRMIAIWIVYGSLIVVCVGLLYVVAGLIFGAFEPGILYIFGHVFVSLFIWLSITTLFGIYTGTPVIGIIVTVLIWIAQKGLEWREGISAALDSAAISRSLEYLYLVLPKTVEIYDMAADLAHGRSVEWMPLYTSLAFAAVITFGALTLFKRKDF